VRSVTGTTITAGEREIEPIEAAVVERIFREFVGGASPKQIAKRLNQEGIKGPFAAQWNPSTIHGNGPRGTGILNNELYVGKLIWNRLRYIKNPDTGRRVSRLNPRSEWIIKEVPDLRIISNELWETTKRRQGGRSANARVRNEHREGAETAIPVFRTHKMRRLRKWFCPQVAKSPVLFWRLRQRDLHESSDDPTRRNRG
jgi:Recombinase